MELRPYTDLIPFNYKKYAVRITHIPTGISAVAMGNKSLREVKMECKKLLRAKLNVKQKTDSVLYNYFLPDGLPYPEDLEDFRRLILD